MEDQPAGGDDPRLNPTAASLLGFLHDGPSSGWELLARAEQRIGAFWSLTKSQVYRELADLAARGLVEAGRPGTRERREYRITAAGRQAFVAWASRPPGGQTTRFPLLLLVSLGRHVPPAALADAIALHRARHAEHLAELEAVSTALGRTADPWTAATVDFGVRYERATLEWLDVLPVRLRGRRRPRS